MEKNIFEMEGEKGELVKICYNLLMTRNVISYESILNKYDGSFFTKTSATQHHLYKTLQKVVPIVVNTLNFHGYSVVQFPRGRNTDYQYVGLENDPLKNFRYRAILYLRYKEISNCIKSKTPLSLIYWPFDKRKREIIFHPHLALEYNSRLFAIGVAQTVDNSLFRRFVVGIDRIYVPEGESLKSASSNYPYIPPLIDEYAYLHNIVGITIEKNAILTKIVLRTHDKYTFGRLKTKPIHNSQKIISYPSLKEGRVYGEFEIEVFPNKELLGQIFSYGSHLELVSPLEYRKLIKKEIDKMLLLYCE